MARDAAGGYAGHTVVRVEVDDTGRRFGLVSTTWVEPACRRSVLARALLRQGEAWFLAQGLDEACTWTSAINAKLIALYAGAGDAEAARGPNAQTGTSMVRLARRLQAPRGGVGP